jgi:hypothetical protein
MKEMYLSYSGELDTGHCDAFTKFILDNQALPKNVLPRQVAYCYPIQFIILTTNVAVLSTAFPTVISL